MSRSTLAPFRLALLHGSGLDELLFIGLGLVAAWVIISTTGRRQPEAAEGEEREPGEEEKE